MKNVISNKVRNRRLHSRELFRNDKKIIRHPELGSGSLKKLNQVQLDEKMSIKHKSLEVIPKVEKPEIAQL